MRAAVFTRILPLNRGPNPSARFLKILYSMTAALTHSSDSQLRKIYKSQLNDAVLNTAKLVF